MKILLIDNYDSFTYNLFHYLSSLKTKVQVYRNDKINTPDIIKKGFDKIVISPGPGNPNQSGNCLKIVRQIHNKIPILGVCLGHQIIGQVFGSKIIKMPPAPIQIFCARLWKRRLRPARRRSIFPIRWATPCRRNISRL